MYEADNIQAPTSRTITVELTHDEEEFLLKLQCVVKKVVGDKSQIASNANQLKNSIATESLLQQREKENEAYDGRNLAERFEKLRDDHRQLTEQIQSSLNALGGGGRAAKALKSMHDQVEYITCLFYVRNGKAYVGYGWGVSSEIFSACRDAVSEVIEAFKELEVFNKALFHALKEIMWQLEQIVDPLDIEYGPFMCYHCQIDPYLGSLFEPLIAAFESILPELTKIAEKEIASIRESQNFTSRRYLLLTTVATFLSSVTATTLQITAGGSGSLTAVINTLWFVSLVFSAASAVYSLLVMTWRQSSVRQPKLALPSLFDKWFRNGPMYSLIAAVTTFSIGLCLLAFHVAEQQGGIVSAAVPTVFAGSHALAILVFSAWFLFEQWKTKDSWVKVRDGYLYSVARASMKTANRTSHLGCRVKRYLKALATRLKMNISTFRRVRDASSRTTGVGTEGDIESVPLENRAEPPLSGPDHAGGQAAEAIEPDNALATPESAPVSLESSNAQEADDDWMPGKQAEYKLFENLLQFSSRGRFLASAYSDTVTIYNVDASFSVYDTIKAPDADQIKQIAWNRRDELLVRSVGGVSTWHEEPPWVWQATSDHSFHLKEKMRRMGHLEETVGPVHWILEGEDKDTAFVSTSRTTVRLFDINCKEKIMPIDISRMHKISRIIDVAFFRETYIFCLADVPDDDECDSLLVINSKTNSIESTRSVKRGHTFMTLSSSAGRILFHGSENGVEVAELSITKTDEGFNLAVGEIDTLRSRTLPGNEMEKPEEEVVFHGNYDKMLIGYSSGEIVGRCKRPGKVFWRDLHRFTSPTAEANPQNPKGFAVIPWNPYMFAFRSESGSVTVWSIQSNTQLSECISARTFEVHDRRIWRQGTPVISTGRFLTLPAPTDS